MSAYILPDFHINALVTWAANKHGSNDASYCWQGSRRDIRGDVKRIASVLHAENVRSVNARYQECDPAHGFTYTATSSNILNPIDVIKACHGYDYQACEASGWEESEAKAIVDGIEACAVRSLAGYSDSPAWCLSSAGSLKSARLAA
jgi:hypothetical protein